MALAPALATAAQLAIWMRRSTFTGAELAQAELVLQVVSAWARSIAGKAWNNDDCPPPDDVVGVILSAARRELSNPDRVIKEDMGPLSVTRADPPEGFFTAGELAILRKKTNGGLFTISTRRESKGWGVGYLHMREELDDEPFPYLNYGEPGWWDTIHL